jgi:hypothetical protein
VITLRHQINGALRGMATDVIDRSIWAYSDRAVFELSISDEVCLSVLRVCVLVMNVRV